MSETPVGSCTASIEVEAPAGITGVKQSLILRRVTSTKFVRIERRITSTGSEFWLVKDEGGSQISQYLGSIGSVAGLLKIKASINDDGLVTVLEPALGISSVSLPYFKAGGTQGEGDLGFRDTNTAATAATRLYRGLVVYPLPPADAVIYAERNARLSGNGMYRQSEDGAGYGPVSYPGADLPRLPVSGESELPVEIALHPSRGDFDSLADSAKDGFTAQLVYRPCWSEIPSE